MLTIALYLVAGYLIVQTGWFLLLWIGTREHRKYERESRRA